MVVGGNKVSKCVVTPDDTTSCTRSPPPSGWPSLLPTRGAGPTTPRPQRGRRAGAEILPGSAIPWDSPFGLPCGQGYDHTEISGGEVPVAEPREMPLAHTPSS